MTDLSTFAITRTYPPADPNRLQLYSAPTPNGVKVSIMLEETGLDYEPHYIDIGNDMTWTPDYLALNPNGKIPAIIDPDGPDGEPLALFESGAILLYLAEKTGKFLPSDSARRYETIQWVFFQMAAIGPMFGQVGFFHKFGEGFRGQAATRPIHQGIEPPARRARYAAEWTQLAHGRGLYDRRYRHVGLGAQPGGIL